MVPLLEQPGRQVEHQALQAVHVRDDRHGVVILAQLGQQPAGQQVAVDDGQHGFPVVPRRLDRPHRHQLAGGVRFPRRRPQEEILQVKLVPQPHQRAFLHPAVQEGVDLAVGKILEQHGPQAVVHLRQQRRVVLHQMHLDVGDAQRPGQQLQILCFHGGTSRDLHKNKHIFMVKIPKGISCYFHDILS